MTAIYPWLYATFFGLMSLTIIGHNMWLMYHSKKNNESTSLTLFIGAIAGVIALLAAPVESLIWLIWLPIVIDPGTGLVLWEQFKNRHKK